ncbi:MULTISPECIES: glycoside hydrolase family 15 protein [unclassified Microbacterium]|uniref:glycoside hydrolase family 15 protein n=1 Tax=unclassified Microbacterium TaxID=2609290 RepID=UPI000EA8C59A|nr:MULTISPECIES: glycoside hydrolase family 15 protein [unclassified Microbacterium]MBT2483269.1 glycoside hydrolase family 15 protein [Microbacterium sp. ISL-108]RKN66310.1 glycoside hydrolase family 15 protein [Microbacterium sp. CGR2]
MPAPIEDYALLSDCRTGALVSREGSMDWLCLPRFDSPSLFGALLGEPSNGRWSLRPRDADATAERHYLSDTFVLVTRWNSADGVAEVHEFMPLEPDRTDVVRRIVGISGRVEFVTELRLHFDYSRSLPWVRQVGTHSAPALHAAAGPEAVIVRGTRLTAQNHAHHGSVVIEAGEHCDLVLSWFPSHEQPPAPLDVEAAFTATQTWWREWASGIVHDGPHRDEVVRSLLVLRALTNRDTGGIVAAATTSLPEEFGGSRNWDYRYVWLRDAALTLEVLISHGFLAEAHEWRQWLLRAIAGEPSEVQIMYGIAGERDLAERVLTSLPGYEGAAPVRIGNGAVDQYQGDVIGEVLVALEAARLAGLEEGPFSWPLQRALVERVTAGLDRPDNGIWEIRGEPQRFTHSRVMMWAALDRGVRAVREHGLAGDAERWEAARDALRREIDDAGVDPDGGYFVQHYGSAEVDASLLVLPQVGYCAADDPRMLATVARIESTLLRDGFVLRYRTESGVDGLPGDEHPFVACSFWLVEQYAASGRIADAEDLMRRLLAMVNDLGLLAEEYDVPHDRQAGNTPQALSHLTLIRAADALAGHTGRAADRH